MRIVRNEEELPGLFKAAQAEAAGAFGNGDLYMETYVEHPRHMGYSKICSLSKQLGQRMFRTRSQ